MEDSIDKDEKIEALRSTIQGRSSSIDSIKETLPIKILEIKGSLTMLTSLLELNEKGLDVDSVLDKSFRKLADEFMSYFDSKDKIREHKTAIGVLERRLSDL